ncbi:Irregular chiasm C-roughest protein [Fragariocoptes setiger]|uniref:Irregular chiasm C-roughest protein n=1 Tax=Fragariocoptes setiger TaxID=1670756 RepID=A0ABQ7S659_9ACAR|nr:Irregular chiasm C-roughest protein [Fragariocoptes setiger]
MRSVSSPLADNAMNEHEQQEFELEPQDVTVRAGHTLVLPCRVAHLRGTVQWTRDGFGLGTERHLAAFPRYLMVGNEANGEFNLQIENATLDDDAQFQCQVSASADHQHHGLRSRAVQVTVLVAPQTLTISARPTLSSSTSGATGNRNDGDTDTDTDTDIETDIEADIDTDSDEALSTTDVSSQLNALSDSEISPQTTTTTSHSQQPNGTNVRANYNTNTDVVRIVTRAGSMLELTCEASGAKPKVELVWLDENGQQVPDTWTPSSSGKSAATGASGPALSFTRLTTSTMSDGKRTITRSVWLMRVHKEQHKHKYTCRAMSPAMDTPMLAYAKLDVKFEPQIHLRLASTNTSASASGAASHQATNNISQWQKMDKMGLRPYFEHNNNSVHTNQAPTMTQHQSTSSQSMLPIVDGDTVRFECSARANPAHVDFRWLINDHELAGEHKRHLTLARVDGRKLNGRTIKCEARNAVGLSRAAYTMHVMYGPHARSLSVSRWSSSTIATSDSAATHRDRENSSELLLFVDQQQLRQPTANKQQQQQQLSAHQRSSAPDGDTGTDDINIGAMLQQPDIQFAVVVDNRPMVNSRQQRQRQVRLKCEFESNPRAQLAWFRMATDYMQLANITHVESQELITSGAIGARFVGSVVRLSHDQHQHQAASSSSNQHRYEHYEYHTGTSSSNNNNNNNSSINLGASEALARLSTTQWATLDFDRMSDETLDELQHVQAHALIGSSQDVDNNGTDNENENENDSADTTHTGRDTHRRHSQQKQTQTPTPKQRTLMSAQNNRSSQQAAVVSKEASNKQLMNEKRTIVSSTLTLDEDTFTAEQVGKYVCKATMPASYQQQAINKNIVSVVSERTMSTYVVMAQAPRIISTPVQRVSIGVLDRDDTDAKSTHSHGHSGATLRLECVAQVHAIVGTQIYWRRSGDPTQRLIGSSSGSKSIGADGTRFTIVEERSPDALFMRSTLLVSGHSVLALDSGASSPITNLLIGRNDATGAAGTEHQALEFNCTVSNALGADSMLISAQKIQRPAGFVSFAVTCLVLGSITIAVCLALVFTFCGATSSHKIQSKSNPNNDGGQRDNSGAISWWQRATGQHAHNEQLQHADGSKQAVVGVNENSTTTTTTITATNAAIPSSNNDIDKDMRHNDDANAMQQQQLMHTNAMKQSASVTSSLNHHQTNNNNDSSDGSHVSIAASLGAAAAAVAQQRHARRLSSSAVVVGSSNDTNPAKHATLKEQRSAVTSAEISDKKNVADSMDGGASLGTLMLGHVIKSLFGAEVGPKNVSQQSSAGSTSSTTSSSSGLLALATPHQRSIVNGGANNNEHQLQLLSNNNNHSKSASLKQQRTMLNSNSHRRSRQIDTQSNDSQSIHTSSSIDHTSTTSSTCQPQKLTWLNTMVGTKQLPQLNFTQTNVNLTNASNLATNTCAGGNNHHHQHHQTMEPRCSSVVPSMGLLNNSAAYAGFMRAPRRAGSHNGDIAPMNNGGLLYMVAGIPDSHTLLPSHDDAQRPQQPQAIYNNADLGAYSNYLNTATNYSPFNHSNTMMQQPPATIYAPQPNDHLNHPLNSMPGSSSNNNNSTDYVFHAMQPDERPIVTMDDEYFESSYGTLISRSSVYHKPSSDVTTTTHQQRNLYATNV